MTQIGQIVFISTKYEKVSKQKHYKKICLTEG